MDDRIAADTREPFLDDLRFEARPSLSFRSEEPLDEKVSETKRHLEARTALYLLIKDAFPGVAVGSEQFVYCDAQDPQKCLAPDVFVKRDAQDSNFDTWRTWLSGSPDIAVEIVSASDRRDHDWAEKLARYTLSGIAEVVRFDPEDRRRPIRVWDRKDGELTERAARSRSLRECRALGLWWVVAPSAHGPMLRLARGRDGSGLLPTPDEDRVRLAGELAEERKARTEAEHDRMLAEHAKAQAEQARTEAEQARAQAEQARAQAEQARTEAEQARSLAERKLRKEAAARQRAGAENRRLRAELARLREQRGSE